jgi:hypothetical protein
MTAKLKIHRTAISVTAFALGLSLVAGTALAQTSKDLVGTWTLVSLTADQGGKKVEPFGPNPKGQLTFSEGGRYSLIVMRSDLPKFASNNRTTGSPEENKAVVVGSNVNFGTYSVEGNQIVLRVEAATFPNANGAEQKRSFSLEGDAMTFIVPVASGGAHHLVWKKTK